MSTIESEVSHSVVYSKDISPQHPFIADHVVNGQTILAGACQLKFVCGDGSPFEYGFVTSFENVIFLRPFIVGKAARSVVIRVDQVDDSSYRFKVLDKELSLYSKGLVKIGEPNSRSVEPYDEECCGSNTMLLDWAQIDRYSRSKGAVYGKMFQALNSISVRDNSIIGSIRLTPANYTAYEGSKIHPVIFDASLRSTIGVISTDKRHLSKDMTYIPFSVGRVRIFYCSYYDDSYYAITRVVEMGADVGTVCFNITVVNSIGDVVMEIERFCLKKIPFRKAA